jgi:hypothetical protein
MRKDIFLTVFGLIGLIWLGPWIQRVLGTFFTLFTANSSYEQAVIHSIKFVWIGIILFLALYIVRSMKTYFLFKMSPFLLLTYLVSINSFSVFNQFVTVFEIELFWRITLTIILVALYYEYQRTYISLYSHPTINIVYDTFLDLAYVLAIMYLPFIAFSNFLDFSFTRLLEIENMVTYTFMLLYLFPVLITLLSIPVIVDARNFYGTYLFKLVIVIFSYLVTYSLSIIVRSSVSGQDINQLFGYFLWIIVAITAAQLFRLSESTDKNL